MDTHLHERLLQLLSTMLMEISALQAQVPPVLYAKAPDNGHKNVIDMSESNATSNMLTSVKMLEQLVRDAMVIVRNMLEDQPAAELEELTLAEVFSHLVEESAERLGVASRIAFSGINEQGQPRERERTLSPRTERLFLLLMREALYGIEQRQEVHRLRLTFNYGENEVQLSLEDDGLNSAPTITLPDAQNGADGNVPILQKDQPMPLFEREAGNLAHHMQIQVQQPILEDLRRRFEQIGGTLVVRALEPRGIRVQASAPYARYSAEPATQQTKAEQSLAPDGGHVEQAIALESISPPVLLPNPETIRVLIVDGQAVSRAGLRHLLESYAGLNIIGEAADGVQAVSETLELGPQVVLMDTHLPEGQSLEALRQIKQLNLDTKVLLLATQDREEYLYETLRAGADGYILKDIAPDELVQAIQGVARGDMLIQPRVASRLISRIRTGAISVPTDNLTNRELEVLRLLARGLKNKEIAARLYVSERTVNFHLTNIYQKLQVSGRTEALSKALEQGLIPTP